MSDVLPDIVIFVSERDRLQCLAQDTASERHPVAAFLAAELARAVIVPSDGDVAAVVTMGSWVKYRLDWGFPAEVKRLVYPEDYMSRDNQVSVLSSIGAALLGLRAGSRMPFAGADGRAHVVGVECVDRTAPVLPLFPMTREIRLPGRDDDPFDPNSAA